MLTLFHLLLTPRTWFHAWREHDALHRECTVCGRREERDPDGDLMCNGPGSWRFSRSGKRFGHFQQPVSRCVEPQSIGDECARDAAHDEPIAT